MMRTNRNSIEKMSKRLEQKRVQLEQGQLNALRELLRNETIEQLCHECSYFFRKRLFTPIVIIFHVIGAAISRDATFQSSWHNTGETGASYQLAKGRKRLPLRLWEAIASWIVEQIDEQFKKEQLWRGHRVVSPDGTCVSMSDTKSLTAAFGKPGEGHNKSKFPLARIVFVFSLKTFVTIGHAIGEYCSSEKSLFLDLLKSLSPRDLIVADSGFAGAALYEYYQRAQVEYLTRINQSVKVDKLQIIETLGKNDYKVIMLIDRSYRRKDPSLPKEIIVRIIKTTKTVKGKTEIFWLVTSLLDPHKYPARAIKNLYARRWKAETLIEQIKIWLGADVLRSQTVAGIKKELCARVIASNLLHWLILKAAKKHKKNVDQISFAATLRLSAVYSIKMSEAPIVKLPMLYDTLLEKIASSIIPYRPDRIEPRAKKRNPTNYPRLKISRSEWRVINGFAA